MAEGREPKPTYALRYRRRMSQPPSSTKLCLLRFVGHVIANMRYSFALILINLVRNNAHSRIKLTRTVYSSNAEVSCSAASVLVVNVIAANQSAKHFLTRGTWPGEICFDAVHKLPKIAQNPCEKVEAELFMIYSLVFGLVAAPGELLVVGSALRPRHVQILSAVGYPKYRKVMEGVEGPSEVTKPTKGSKIGGSVGNKVVAVVGSRLETSSRGLLDIQYPITHGSVTDWEGMEHIWRHVFSEGLKCRSQEHPVLISEPPLNPMIHREKLAECLFEVFKVPAIHIACSPVLSLYASGRTTGVVLDIGDGVAQVMPVYEGYAVGHAATRGESAGRSVTEWLQLSLKRQCGVHLLSTADREIVRTMKEDCCAVSLHPAVQRAWRGGTDAKSSHVQYELPDGSIINIGLERFQAPEIIFNPTMAASADQGVHLLLDEAIQKSDMDLRRTLLQNVVLAGGSTLFPGFGERLLSEMRKLVPKDARIKICAPPERESHWGALYFGLYDTMKGRFMDDERTESVFWRWVMAQVSTTAAGVVSYPFDTVRRKMMANARQTGFQSEQLSTSWQCWKHIFRNEGFKGFFRGSFSTILRGLGGALVLVLYDEAKFMLYD
ncbi:Actin-6, putative [Perkinsus marinus ATCC 50983]|uniref:Actin-6, putative n=1 Tax=Perkinsus marinus (strain ATCC 50983 / TXsc) TaxID=423536 RepID=C5LC76_PERM5|nr:Actin-6, putative [Perkinsus marinus ATCC 50983]EER05559.1 Actin-6, putative [Perkinsus marinus ATCC 50983]|eukprot:XP_002773743.1 Actin-6, putative [Perkinsus marinus ATCC 50983]